MKCPSCGDDDEQWRVGRLRDYQRVVYHCEACQHLYAIEDDGNNEEDGEE